MREASCSTDVLPPRLRKGDLVAVPAPAGPVPEDEFFAGLEILQSRYRVVYDESIFRHSGFLAGTDEERATELNRYLGDREIRAVFCARGGYGTLRIVDRLDAAAFRRAAKAVVGFSDATVLLAWCLGAAGVRPVHGPTVSQLGRLSGEDVDWLFRILEDPSAPGQGCFPILRPIGRAAVGTRRGRLVGGNLELVTRLVGTPWQFAAEGSVFFFEDVGERPYRLDRMLTHLKLAGAIDGAVSAVVGSLVRCEEPGGGGPCSEEVVGERLRSFGIPAMAGLPVGHGTCNAALPLGAMASLDFSSNVLALEEGAVA
ncbi:MAG: LD-carboxypeptidase [Pseudomonadota bacterium]